LIPVKPSLAFACLRSVPLDKDKAIGQIQALRPIYKWQSTIDWNKKPPYGYLSEGVDLMKGLDEMEASLKANETTWLSLFEFLAELQLLVGRMREAHFSTQHLLLDLVAFVPGAKFASISEDGRGAPEIFLHGIVSHLQNLNKVSL
jgi:hypothetical protein